MLCGGMACHSYGMCTVRCVECDCTHHSKQYTYRNYDMPYHRITFNVVVFTEF